jgi:hypothetical protein
LLEVSSTSATKSRLANCQQEYQAIGNGNRLKQHAIRKIL